MKTLSADLLLLPVVLIWGAHFAVVKRVLVSVDPMAFGLVRFALAFLMVAGLAWAGEGTLRLERPDRGPMLRLGAVGALSQVLWLFGISRTASGKAALLMATSPAFVALLRAAGGERLSWRAALGFLTALGGVSLIVNVRSTGQTAGDLLTLGAAVTWALYTNMGPRLLSRYSAVRVTAYVFLVTTSAAAALGLSRAVATPWAAVAPAVLPGLGYSAILAGGLSWVLWYRGVSRLGPMRVMLYQYMIPVVALAVSILWLKEPFRWAQGLGAALVLAGTLLARVSLSPAATSGGAIPPGGEPAAAARDPGSTGPGTCPRAGAEPG